MVFLGSTSMLSNCISWFLHNLCYRLLLLSTWKYFKLRDVWVCILHGSRSNAVFRYLWNAIEHSTFLYPCNIHWQVQPTTAVNEICFPFTSLISGRSWIIYHLSIDISNINRCDGSILFFTFDFQPTGALRVLERKGNAAQRRHEIPDWSRHHALRVIRWWYRAAVSVPSSRMRILLGCYSTNDVPRNCETPKFETEVSMIKWLWLGCFDLCIQHNVRYKPELHVVGNMVHEWGISLK